MCPLPSNGVGRRLHGSLAVLGVITAVFGFTIEPLASEVVHVAVRALFDVRPVTILKDGR